MIEFRKDLSAPAFMQSLKDYFSGIPDHRNEHGNKEISLSSALMSACAMFSLKFSSLLQFDQKRKDPTIVHNLKTLFHVDQAPCAVIALK